MKRNGFIRASWPPPRNAASSGWRSGCRAWVNSDHLTALAGLASAGAGICYWIGPGTRGRCSRRSGCSPLNWFGDSLDGTLARVRHHERPRYGFYVDHVLDVIGILLLLAGFALGGFMTPMVAAGFLIAYYLLMVEIALATHAVGTFRISFWKFGPTELRILLAIGTLQLLRSPYVTIAGERMLLFDVGGDRRDRRARGDVHRVRGHERNAPLQARAVAG